MEAFFWAALGFLVLTAVGGAALVAVRGWRAWQAFTSFAAGAGGGVDRLLTRAEELAAHGERTSARVEELLAAVERLRRAQGRARILVGALDDALGLVRAFRGVVPQK